MSKMNIVDVFKKNKKRTNDVICVIGAGTFGTAAINKLIAANKEVVVIDNDAAITKNLASNKRELVDIYTLDATNMESLKSIHIEQYNTVIVAFGDNLEIVSNLVQLRIKNVIARSSSLRNSAILKTIGAAVIIRPEEEAGEKAALIAANRNYLLYSNLVTAVDGGFFVSTINITSKKFLNVPLSKLNFQKKLVNVSLVKRKNSWFLPTGDTIFKEDDLVTFIGELDDLIKVLALVNKNLVSQETKDLIERQQDFIELIEENE